MPRHRHQEFLAFLKQVAKAHPRTQLYAVCDNYATHKHPTVQAWLTKHRRVQLHFEPVRVFRRSHRRDRDLHRRLERNRRTVHLDQNRRRTPRQDPPIKN
jgi:predicted secreted Zn-dependent protease